MTSRELCSAVDGSRSGVTQSLGEDLIPNGLVVRTFPKRVHVPEFALTVSGTKAAREAIRDPAGMSQISKRYLAGETAQSIADSEGVTKGTVYKWLRALGFGLSEQSEIFEKDENPGAMYGEHGSIRALAKIKGVSYGCMRNALTRAGVELNPPTAGVRPTRKDGNG